MADLNAASVNPRHIYNLAKECIGLFCVFRLQILAGRLVDGSGSYINPDVVQEQELRFRTWIAEHGVFAEPSLSLDVKMEGHSELQEMVLMLLYIIKERLKEGQY
jgi:hypothetical protein